MSRRPAIPPATPPAIAPTLVGLFEFAATAPEVRAGEPADVDEPPEPAGAV